MEEFHLEMQKFTGRIETKKINMQEHSKLLLKGKKGKKKAKCSAVKQIRTGLGFFVCFLFQYNCLKDIKLKINCVVYHVTIHQTDLLKNCHFSAGKRNFISILQISTKLQHIHIYLFCIFNI